MVVVAMVVELPYACDDALLAMVAAGADTVEGDQELAKRLLLLLYIRSGMGQQSNPIEGGRANRVLFGEVIPWCGQSARQDVYAAVGRIPR